MRQGVYHHSPAFTFVVSIPRGNTIWASSQALDVPEGASGSYGMNYGINVRLRGDFHAAGVVLKAMAAR
jgi:hypothetical protein